MSVLGSLMLNVSAVQAQLVVQRVQPSQLVPDFAGKALSTLEPTIVTLQLTTPVAITASSPTPSGFQDPQGTDYSSFLRYGDREVSSGATLTINATGEVDVEAGMRVIRSQPYPAGDYSYNVFLTITAP